MIPRYQRIAYWCLMAAIALMGVVLIRGCERNRERIAAMRDQSPIAAPTDVPNETVSLAQANDADGSVRLEQVSLALPEEPAQKAQALLERMLTDASLPASTHPVPAQKAVTEVFLVGLPLAAPGGVNTFAAPSPFGHSSGDIPQTERTSAYGMPHSSGAQLAVVNLTKTFADAHASGVETEDLTVRAIIATLHENLPQVEQVRFLVDGQTRETLAGHADFTRAYGVKDPVKAVHVLSADGSIL